MKFFTVYLVNHNYSKYIQKSLDSIYSQSYKNFELLIFDNGSTDNSRSIISNYKNYKNTKVFFQKNIGLNSTNNIAINKAKSKYILRVDADDWIHSDFLELAYKKIKSNPKIDVLIPDYYKIDEEGNILEQFVRHDFNKVTLFNQPAHGACTIFKIKKIKEVGSYDESFKCQDGYDLWLKLLKKNAYISNINLPLFYYRQHKKNLTKKIKKILDTKKKINEKNSINLIKKKILAIIPTRGKYGVYKLYKKKLGNISLIEHKIKQLLMSKKINHICISSPDLSLLKELETKYKKKLLYDLREKNLSNFNSKIEDSLVSVLKKLDKNYDYIVKANIESPFILASDYDDMISELNIHNGEKLLVVEKTNDNYFKHNGKNLVSLQKSASLKIEREEIFKLIPTVNIFKSSIFNKTKNKKSHDIQNVHYLLDSSKNYIINDEKTLKIANFIKKNISKNHEK